MFFRKTKTQILERADNLKQTLDSALAELVQTRQELITHSDDYVLRVEGQIDQFRRSVMIFAICYSILVFGMLITLLLFVI